MHQILWSARPTFDDLAYDLILFPPYCLYNLIFPYVWYGLLYVEYGLVFVSSIVYCMFQI